MMRCEKMDNVSERISMLIRTNRVFFGLQKQARVEELMLVHADTLVSATVEEADQVNEPQSIFLGSTMINVVSLDENGNPVQVVPQEITFPIEANNRIEAFEKFEEAAKEY